MLKIYLSIFIFLAMLSCIIIVGKYTEVSDYRPKITASIGVFSEAVEKIGSDFVLHANVKGNNNCLQTTIINDEAFNIYLYNGLNPRETPNTLLNSSSFISVSDNIDDEDLIKLTSKSHIYNPYFWMDVSLWIKTVSHITDILIETTPINEQIYGRNEERYIIKLRELDEYIRTQASKIPENKRFIVTASNSFDYFAKAYGFQTISLYNQDMDNNISFGNIIKLSEYIVENNIKVIFKEASISDRYLNVLKDVLNTQNYHIDIGGTLYSDIYNHTLKNMNYTEIMIHNIDTITNALKNKG